MSDVDTACSRELSAYPVVLFDFDGTVADTVPAILRVAEAVFAKHGMAFDRLRMLLMIGPPLEEGFMQVGDLSEEDARTCAAEYRDLFNEILTPADYPVLPGIVELLNALKARGIRLAIATSRFESTARRMAGELGLTQFDAIAGRVPDVRYTKAESIVAALEMLGVDAHQVLMVGDRRYDVEGAAELGIPCVGVYTGAAAEGELEAAGAIAVAHGTEGLAAVFGINSMA